MLLLLVFDEVVLALDLYSHMLQLLFWVILAFFFELLHLLTDGLFVLLLAIFRVFAILLNFVFAFPDFAKSTLAEWLSVDKIVGGKCAHILDVPLGRRQSLVGITWALLFLHETHCVVDNLIL